MTTPNPGPDAPRPALGLPAGTQPAATAKLSLIGRCLAWMRVMMLSTYPIVGTAIAFYVVAFSDQGVDMLLDALSQLWWRHDESQQTLGSDPLPVLVRALVSGGSVLVAALSIWYPARRLLCRNFRFYPIDAAATAALREWLPRMLAMLVPLGVAVGYGRLAAHSGELFPALLAAMWLAVAIVLVAVLHKRRAWLKLPVVAEMNDALPQATAAAVVAACVAYVVLALAFAASPVALPRFFGGTALIFFGVGGLTFIATMVIVYWPLSKGSPTLTVLATFYILVIATWLDNHGMRAVDQDVALAPVLRPAERAAAWTAARTGSACTSAGAVPVLYVAAAGGGIRAGYWTTRVLEELSLQLGRDFDCSLFALSGVSGGSLGVAAYVAVNRDHGVARIEGAASAPSGDARTAATPYRASRTLGQDFLSPAVAGLLFYDALQRIVPVPIHALDRSRGLESGFQRAFDAIDGQPFRHPLRALDRGSPRMPMLFLNATIVEDGRRAIQSNVDLSDFFDVYDLGCPRLNASVAPSTASISLASAVHNSARFTYVSPAGRVARLSDCAGGPASDARVVDGGYFENSGAATLVQLLCALDACDRPRAAVPATSAASDLTGTASASSPPATRPVLLLIRNSPGTRPYCTGEHADARCLPLSTDRGSAPSLAPSHLLPEVISPLQALLTVREQRERLSVVAAAETFRSRGGVVVEAYLPILEKTVPEPPLGWSLSPGVRAGLDEGARSIVAGCRDTLRALFAGAPLRSGCDEPGVARGVAARTTRIATEGPSAASAASPTSAAQGR